MKEREYDIHDRIFKFVINVINLLNKLPKTPANLIFINQCIRSVTSMGANDQEADGALTRKDFIHCFTTVRKEGKETVFWLRIINSTNIRFAVDAGNLSKEGGEIVAIVSTIIKNADKNKKERK
ncbi:four helix bundle protein [Candidatus Microgenomates bacterium]|nr:four helix bundle protein [Candidatus Microgenomates bacterium]